METYFRSVVKDPFVVGIFGKCLLHAIHSAVDNTLLHSRDLDCHVGGRWLAIPAPACRTQSTTLEQTPHRATMDQHVKDLLDPVYDSAPVVRRMPYLNDKETQTKERL